MIRVLYISPYLDAPGSAQYGGSLVSYSNLQIVKNSFSTIGKVYSVAVSRTTDVAADYAIIGSNNKLMTAINNCLTLSGRLDLKALKQFELIIKDINPTVIYLDTSFLGVLAKIIKVKFPNIFVVSFFHNIEVDFELARIKSNEYHYLPSLWSAYINERRCVKYSDLIFCLHEHDSNRLNKLYGRRSDLNIPVTLLHSTGLNHVKKKTTHAKKIVFGFLGSAFYANIQAARIIATEIAPKFPCFQFLIAGRGFEIYKNEFLQENVNVMGAIDSVDLFYEQIDVFLAPIYSGAGMKVKIAEACAYNKVILASDFSLHGYERIIDGVNVHSFDSVGSLVNILTDFSLQLDCNTRSYFERHFCVESLSSYVSNFMMDKIDENIAGK